MVSPGLRIAAIVLAALSFGPSFAHLLEAPPRLTDWPPELWRETTVFHGQYLVFGALGGPIELATVAVTAVVAALAVRRRDGAVLAVAAAVLFAAALAAWLTVVRPANGVMATWRPGPLPADFLAVRNRWESGHMVMAALKFAAVCLVAWWAVRPLARPFRD
jgi:hypothetical protein